MSSDTLAVNRAIATIRDHIGPLTSDTSREKYHRLLERVATMMTFEAANLNVEEKKHRDFSRLKGVDELVVLEADGGERLQ